MGIEQNKRCETYLLDDLPAESDAFASTEDSGPHQRVADAIAEMIESSEVGGKAIGLEGGWGSGKSTVVRFLSDRFSNNDDYTVVLFDAWAHEGDPLRRTFIEAIVHELCEYGWADKKAWKKKLEELANRRKKTTTRITPKPTDLGKAMAISLLLVPLGTALIAGGFRSGVSVGVGLPPNWFFCLGLYLVLFPFWVLLYRFVQLRTRVTTLTPGLIPLGAATLAEGCYRGVTFGGTSPNWFVWIGLVLTAGPIVHWLYRWWDVSNSGEVDPHDTTDPGVENEEDNEWAFLISRAINETETETIETPNPTSIEFDGYFADLMEESLKSESRRLLLVLDNLDRVDAETALSIWGTLQTFLHDRDHGTEEWYKQLWVVVPYDPIRIRKLWNHPEEQSLTDKDEQKENGASEARRTTESFLDKSFQVRFHVAPPVLSDWKSFLYDLVKEALPSHSDDCHLIYRVFDHCRARGGDPPTPRELKLFVNQIGAIHRQWQHEFPLAHVAFFVLSRKKYPQIIDALRKDDFLSDDDCRLLNDDLISSLAGLAFNVKASKGLELLLADSISGALKKTEPDDLQKIAERNGAGFWAVLETVATTRWHDEDALGLTKISSQLSAAGLLDLQERPEKQSVLHALREAGLNMKAWEPISSEFGSGLCDLLTIQSATDFSTTVLKRYCICLAKSKATEQETLDAAMVAQATFDLFDHARSLGHGASIPKTVTLPFQGEKWITASTEIESADNEETYWSRLRPSGKIEDVLEAFVSKVASGEFSATDVVAIKVTEKCTLKCDWQPLCTAIKDRLDSGQSATGAECSNLCQALFQLEAMGVEASTSTQTTLCRSGHLLHHFHQAKSQNNASGQASIVLSFVRKYPNLKKTTTAGNSDTGHQMLVATMSETDDEVATELHSLATRYGLLPDLLKVIQESDEPHALLIAVLKLVADSDSPELVFSPNVISDNWSSLRAQLNEKGTITRFQNLVGTLAKANGLCECLQDAGFGPEASLLYLDTIRGAKGAIPEFVKWLRDGLQGMGKDEWLADLVGNNANCAVCIELSQQGNAPELTISFADALRDHAEAIVKGKDIPTAWIAKKWSVVVGCIDDASGTRKVLREHLIDIASSAKGAISDEFFDMYGSEIDDSRILAAQAHVLSRFFTPLISENHERGLSWIEGFAKRNPNFIAEVEAEHTAQDFTIRLQEFVDGPSENEGHETIASIAAHFGIRPTPKREETEMGNEEQEADKESAEE
ncbi:P-loop NTPase fold protein [Rosistilla oblonga]|uniref:P-loop NTPase fold protein n=1 Tax=Rosistilla oblonga TaxID=2527990 RepID=UPI003A97C834